MPFKVKLMVAPTIGASAEDSAAVIVLKPPYVPVAGDTARFVAVDVTVICAVWPVATTS